MAVQLLATPAAVGKTAYVRNLVRSAAQGLRAISSVRSPLPLPGRLEAKKGNETNQ